MRSLCDIQFLKFKINSRTKSPTLDVIGCAHLVLVGEQRKMGERVLSGMDVAVRCGLLV